MRTLTGYQIVDCHTHQTVSKLYSPNHGRRARAQAEKLNQAYGAVRYATNLVWNEPLPPFDWDNS